MADLSKIRALDCEMSVRTFNLIKRSCYEDVTLADLHMVSDDELRSQSFGVKNIREIRKTIEDAQTQPEPDRRRNPNQHLTVLQVAMLHGDMIITCPRPARHSTLIHGMRDMQFPPECQGFLLSDGTFAGRFRAGQVAWEAGQIDKFISGPELYSEDLW